MTTDTPAPAPEWAHDMVQEFENSGGVGPLSADAYVRFVALLATLRERTLREAAGVSGKRADEFNRLNVEGGMGKAKSYQHGQEAMACGGAILSLIAQPPKPERGDGSEAEGREEA